jgi:hypothetical protein
MKEPGSVKLEKKRMNLPQYHLPELRGRLRNTLTSLNFVLATDAHRSTQTV